MICRTQFLKLFLHQLVQNELTLIETERMAILKNPRDYDFRGHINKQVVIRQYSGGRTVLSTYPDMSNIKPSAGQKEQRLSFNDAQAYAKQYLSDPERKAFYREKCKPGQRPHNVLISELLKKDQPAADPVPKGIIIVSGKRSV